MNHFVFDDLHIWTNAEVSLIVDCKMSKRFPRLTDNKNTIHIDAEYSQLFGFKDQVAHGFVRAPLLFELVEDQLPRVDSLGAEFFCVLSKPVFLQDNFRVSGLSIV